MKLYIQHERGSSINTEIPEKKEIEIDRKIKKLNEYNLFGCINHLLH